MAIKAFPLFSFILLIFFPLLCHPVFADHSNDNKTSPFEFLNHLQGCHKGDKVKGIHKLKKYLEGFGYLHYNKSNNQSHANDDEFDNLLESAIKTYQLNFHLKTTGTLDAKTVSKMTMPRCGVADIVNGTNWMRSGKKRHHHGSKWPATKSHLTYAFRQGTRADARSPVARAFETWAANTHFTFAQTQDYTNADITIGFHSRDHGDEHPFDGNGGNLAHAWAPTDGRFHYDADESWAVGATQGAFDLQTVAIHEIGHLLGLGHSSVAGAIMYPSITPGVTKGLHRDDIQGIQALYRNERIEGLENFT